MLSVALSDIHPASYQERTTYSNHQWGHWSPQQQHRGSRVCLSTLLGCSVWGGAHGSDPFIRRVFSRATCSTPRSGTPSRSGWSRRRTAAELQGWGEHWGWLATSLHTNRQRYMCSGPQEHDQVKCALTLQVSSAENGCEDPRCEGQSSLMWK